MFIFLYKFNIKFSFTNISYKTKNGIVIITQKINNPNGFISIEPIKLPCNNKITALVVPQDGQGRCVMFLKKQIVLLSF